VNKTILQPHVAAAACAQYVYVGFSRRNKIPRTSAYTISEEAIRFRPELLTRTFHQGLGPGLGCQGPGQGLHSQGPGQV